MILNMKVLIVGYGRMGREVEKILLERNHEIVGKIDIVQNPGVSPELTEELASTAEVAIEFSTAGAVLANAKTYVKYSLNAVVGTTGWYSEVERLKEILKGGEIGYIYGSNFSIGAQLFFKIVGYASKLFEPFSQYDIMGYELHHKRKKDSPSGTAISLANIILNNNRRKKKIVTEKLDRAIAEDELHFASVRGGEIPGIHSVLIDSLADTVTLTHSARSRAGFALGAVLAAEWIVNRKGLFTVEDFINSTIEK